MRKVILKAGTYMFAIFLILSFFINWGVRYKIEEARFVSQAESLFWQIDQIILTNNQEIDMVVEDFSNQCLINAMTAAYMSDLNPSLREDMDELTKVAALIGVDEIHFFTAEGVIYAGTHPEYYGYSFDSGEQMAFFLPMLEDKSLMLCQDITPNTAEEKPMQYASVWNESGTEIVQIGVTPARVVATQSINEISDVFDMMPISDGQTFLAIDPETYEVVGSTAANMVGHDISDFGIIPDAQEMSYALTNDTLETRTVGDDEILYLTHQFDDLLIITLYEQDSITYTVTMDSLITAIYILLFSIISSIFITIYLDRKIVKSIITINSKLEAIEQGDLSVTIAQNTVPEIKALSDHINAMVRSLINQAHKLSIALDLAQIPTGIVEYNTVTKKITSTSKVREILHLTSEEYAQAFSNADTLAHKLTEIRENNITVEKHVLRFKGTDNYIKMEPFHDGDSTLVLLMDITKEIQEKETIKHQRDTDVLTNLYNRRAFYDRADALFTTPHTPYSAICMIDLDNLKMVNDIYGHEVGDLYIKSIANLIRFEGDFVAGRLGGDEFVALLYNVSSETLLLERIRAFQQCQDGHSITVGQGTMLPLSFSVGFALSPVDSTDYTALIKIADERMYQNKCIRKGGTQNVRHQR